MKANATLNHYNLDKQDRKQIKRARKNRNIARSIKRGSM